ncbi:hypothetical protein DK66_3151 [Brucella suis 1330]|nr:hypothetical protein DK66_3151 [Brucella suis 1330]
MSREHKIADVSMLPDRLHILSGAATIDRLIDNGFNIYAKPLNQPEGRFACANRGGEDNAVRKKPGFFHRSRQPHERRYSLFIERAVEIFHPRFCPGSFGMS